MKPRIPREQRFWTPACEVCRLEATTSFSVIKGVWRFVGECADDIESYYVQIRRFLRSADEKEDWIRHLDGKSWAGGAKFHDMIARYQDAGGQVDVMDDAPDAEFAEYTHRKQIARLLRMVLAQPLTASKEAA